jgi:hypothetical protein
MTRLMLLIAGIEPNPGPPRRSDRNRNNSPPDYTSPSIVDLYAIRLEAAVEAEVETRTAVQTSDENAFDDQDIERAEEEEPDPDIEPDPDLDLGEDELVPIVESDDEDGEQRNLFSNMQLTT